MPVIAMNQELGAGGEAVAEQLAAELGLRNARHEVLQHVAERMHLQPAAVERFLEGRAGLLQRLGTDESSIALFRAEEVLELARTGDVVIRGWGAACLLRPIAHVMCVRVGAPEAVRARRIAAQLGIDDQALALEQVRHSDAAHTANVQHQFGVRWGDPMIYDLTLNTERLSTGACVAQIKALSLRPEFAETAASRARLSDLTVEYHVRAALRADTRTATVGITIEVQAGRVCLRGIVTDQAEARGAADVAAAVPGVTRVDNELRTMEGSNLFPSPRM